MFGFELLENQAVSAVHGIRAPITTIGRDALNDIVLSDDDVSRIHAAIYQRNDGSCLLRDLGSRNGVRVNGRRIVEEVLQPSDLVELGSTRIRFSSTVVPESTGKAKKSLQSIASKGGDSKRKSSLPLKTRTRVQLLPSDLSAGETFRFSCERIACLYEFARRLESARSIEDACRVLLNALLQSCPAENVLVILVEDDGGVSTSGTCFAMRTREDAEILICSSRLQRAIDERQPVLEQEAVLEAEDGSESSRGAKVSSLLCAPLICGEQPLGALYMDNRSRPGVFGEDEARLVMTLAHMCASTLERASRRDQAADALDLGACSTFHDNLLGISRPIRDLRAEIERVATAEGSVLITGPTGSGKDLVARGIHHESKRRDGPFVAINCGALPEALIESEIFGYAPRSGISNSNPQGKPGHFELADKGVLFLDEIGEMPFSLQSRLLRVISTGEVQRLSATSPKRVDVRVVAATLREPETMVKEKKLREDVYYRLNVFRIQVPPLRERRIDIPMLACHYLAHYRREAGRPPMAIVHGAMQRLVEHEWLGNVRQLMTVMNRAAFCASVGALTPQLLAKCFDDNSRGDLPLKSLQEMEREHICKTLRRAQWQKRHASEILGISRQTLDNKIEFYGLAKESSLEN